MSSAGFGPRSSGSPTGSPVTYYELWRLMEEAADSCEELVGFRPSPETLVKLWRLRELLVDGVPIRRAIRAIGLGWRSYYRYAPCLYLGDPKLPLPLPRGYLRQYTRVLSLDVLELLRSVLGELAKYVALDLASTDLLRGGVRSADFGREWLELARALLKVWIHEIAMDILEQELRPMLLRSLASGTEFST